MVVIENLDCTMGSRKGSNQLYGENQTNLFNKETKVYGSFNVDLGEKKRTVIQKVGVAE